MTELKRSLNLPLLLLYGLGTILGAGIYVLTGEVAADAGTAAPLSFLIAAAVAAPTAYSYAKLSASYPKAAGEAVYVDAAFNRRWLSNLIGTLVICIGVVSAATIARGFVGYVNVIVELPDALTIAVLIAGLTALAVYGVLASASVAAAIALLEIAGLIIIIAGGLAQSEYQPIELSGGDAIPLSGIFAGAFLAFYAFIGFEDIVNMAEETQQAERTVPLAILGSLALAAFLYFAVAFIAVMTVPINELAGSTAPMALVVESHGYVAPGFIAGISMLAVVNGALVQMIMASRVLYGISNMQPTLAYFAKVNDRTQTPIVATIFIGLIVLALALSLDIRKLASLTSIVTLIVFTLINLALCKLQQTHGKLAIAQLAIPWLGAALCIALLVIQWV